MTRVLAIVPCTGLKANAVCNAEDLYQGRGHRLLMSGVAAARQIGISIDLRIVSARHGLLKGTDLVCPYDETFSGLPKHKIVSVGEKMQLPSLLQDLLTCDSYDLGIVALGSNSAKACGAGQQILMASYPILQISAAGEAAVDGWIADALVVRLHKSDCTRFSAPHTALKGAVSGGLLHYAARGGLQRLNEAISSRSSEDLLALAAETLQTA
jgi:hypothetical protein